MTGRRLSTIAWFGVLGGAAAWALQFVVGMQIGLARCESHATRFNLAGDAWAIGLAASAALIIVGAELAAFGSWRATRDGESVAAQRIHFLATVGLAINPLMFAVTIMAGVGVPLLWPCQQS